MNTCKHCSKEYQAKRATSQYCSPQCRKLAFQDKGVSVPEVSVPAGTALSVPDVPTLKEIPLGPATLEDYHDPDGRHYAQRTNPELLNWGRPMSMHQLEMARLKANRVPIPGDHDYSGCCEQVDGKWQVKSGD